MDYIEKNETISEKEMQLLTSKRHVKNLLHALHALLLQKEILWEDLVKSSNFWLVILIRLL